MSSSDRNPGARGTPAGMPPDARPAQAGSPTAPPAAHELARNLEGDPHRPGPPQRLGDFELGRQLGRGAFGIVFEARQVSLAGRRVALKVLPLVPALGEHHLARFRREAESGAKLAHPHLVAVYGLGEADGVHFIAQELVEGGRTLADWIKDVPNPGALDGSAAYYRRVAELFARVADALHVVHTAGLVHRDIKPTNILITRDGQPKLGDFGMALDREALTLTESGAVPGTPAYMSPEQARADAQAVDARSDIFSLGATFYEALTFVRAFYGYSLMQVLDKILRGEPRDPRTVCTGVPRDLAVICLKALERDPDRRYQTAADFAADLRRFLADEPIHARPDGPLRRTLKWVRRHPTLASTGVLLVVALAVVTSLLVNVVRTRDRLQRFTDRGQALALRESSAELDVPREELIPGLEAWLVEARGLVDRLPAYREELARTQDQGLVDLVASLELLLADADRDSIAGVERRLQSLLGLRRRSINSAAAAWSTAAAEIADETLIPAYRGLRLPPQLGLVPLGRDPDSGLYEFLHVESGEAPGLDARQRRVVNADTGLILVLIPGGATTIGATRDDETAPNFDPNAKDVELPAFTVELAPYFLSKYEMTQAQWARIRGRNPSIYSRGQRNVGPTNPVEHVSWLEAADTLRRVGLRLPTEVQWEHAARGGEPSRWNCGPQMECLQASANLADRSHRRETEQESSVDWDDGFGLHAPVGSLGANGFGLHDTIGNVMEWCANPWDLYRVAVNPCADDERSLEPASLHALRGGAYDGAPAEYGRVSQRVRVSPELKSANFGVRPARCIDP